jgi:hypothetical protein
MALAVAGSLALQFPRRHVRPMEVGFMKRFVPFLLTTLVVLLPIALLLTVLRGASFRSKVEGLGRRERIQAARAKTAREA